MGISLWITIISICCMLYDVTGSTADSSEETTVQTMTNPASKSQNLYISISVPISLLLLAAIIITVLVFIYRRKRGRALLHQESVNYGNAGNVSLAVEPNGYKPTENTKDNYGSKPPLTLKEDPIYINVQGERSLESSVDGDQTENIYCNVGYNKQQ